jgi:hypothetical protein
MLQEEPDGKKRLAAGVIGRSRARGAAMPGQMGATTSPFVQEAGGRSEQHDTDKVARFQEQLS